MDTLNIIATGVLGWLAANVVIMFVETIRGYKGIGLYSNNKVIALLFFWPVAYPVLLIFNSEDD